MGQLSRERFDFRLLFNMSATVALLHCLQKAWRRLLTSLSASLAFSAASAASPRPSLSSSNSSSPFFHLVSPCSTSAASLLFSFSSSSMRCACSL